MIVRMMAVALLAALASAARAQPIPPPDRTAELMQLQFNSRIAQPPPDSMDGARATAIYKRFSEPAGHGGQAQNTAASTAGAAAQ
jgi:hypothetical protein